MGQLGDYFARLADDEDRAWVLVVDPNRPDREPARSECRRRAGRR